jgi:hypothetical protein
VGVAGTGLVVVAIVVAPDSVRVVPSLTAGGSSVGSTGAAHAVATTPNANTHIAPRFIPNDLRPLGGFPGLCSE